jgi:hypothetical protein
MFPLISGSRGNNLLIVIELKIPNLHNPPGLLFPASDLRLLFRIEIEMFFLLLALTKLITNCLQSILYNQRTLSKLVDGWSFGTVEGLERDDLAGFGDLLET